MTALANPHDHRLRERSQDFALWLFSSLPLLLLAALITTLAGASPARANAPVCTGQNLAEKIKAEDPQRFRAIEEEARQVANGRGIFWKVEKDGLPASFLFGTMHASDPRILALPESVRKALDDSRAVVIESTEVIDENKARETLVANPELTIFTDGRSIEALLPQEDVAALETLLAARGIPLPAVSRMKPWILMSFISLPACELARKAQNPDFLDRDIARKAEAAGKTVLGLETLVEQFSAFADLPLDFHLKALAETTRLGSTMDDVFETMVSLYVSGEIGMIVPLIQSLSPDSESGYAAFEERVVTARNHLMAERAAPILGDGGAFIAVGALHLPGKEGLVELLREQGFTLTPLS